MVKDTVTGESLRADKLLEDIIDDLLAKNPAMPTVRYGVPQHVSHSSTEWMRRFNVGRKHTFLPLLLCVLFAMAQ